MAEKFIRMPGNEEFYQRQKSNIEHEQQDAHYTDFTVWCGGKAFPCHRLILAASSPVLSEMLECCMAEATNLELRLPENLVSKEAFALILNYLYNPQPINIPEQMFISVIRACDFLQIEELKNDCLVLADRVIMPCNLVSWFHLAYSLRLDSLLKKCSRIMASTLTEVSKEAEFVNQSFEYVLNCLAAAEQFKADSVKLFEASIIWCSHDERSRLEQMQMLLEPIFIARSSTERLLTLPETHKMLLQNNPSVYTMLCGLQELAFSQSSEHRKTSPKWHVMSERFVMSLQMDNNNEFHEVRAPIFKEYISVCKSPGGFIVTGGKHDSLCMMFITYTQSWIQLPSLMKAR